MLVYLLGTIKFLGEVFVEAATEGLFGFPWIKIDSKKPIRLACGVLKEFIEAIQIHVTPNLLVYLLELILILELEQAEKRAVLTNQSWQPACALASRILSFYAHGARKSLPDMATNVMCMCLARVCVTGSGPLGGGRGSYRGP